MSSSLEGRVAVVFGVANKRSIAWSIAQGLHHAGAKVAITYQNERLELEARELIALAPNYGPAYVELGHIYQASRRFEEATEIFNKVLQLSATPAMNRVRPHHVCLLVVLRRVAARASDREADACPSRLR